ncbi:MAG: phosphate acetyltransferase [Clostridia bacterium]
MKKTEANEKQDELISNIIEKLKKEKRRSIILPESSDIRVVEAASKIAALDFCNITLIGNKEEIEAKYKNIDLSKVNIVDNMTSPKREEYIKALYELRKEKGMTLVKAEELMQSKIYFGVMMVKLSDADGLVSGAAHSTADTLRPALQILKTKKDAKCVSSFFLMKVPDCTYGSNGAFIFSDAGLIVNPTPEELAEIAYQSSKSFEKLVKDDARIAMLSYSTKGSAKGEHIDKVTQGYKLAKELHPHLNIDGELQLDAAIVPEVGMSKASGSPVAGHANVLIFPNLDAGNIGYKLVQRLAKANAYGPITQGLAKPVNDLSRGCNSDDIVGAVAITAVQVED